LYEGEQLNFKFCIQRPPSNFQYAMFLRGKGTIDNVKAFICNNADPSTVTTFIVS